MKAFLAVVVALFIIQGVAFSTQTPAPQNDVLEKTKPQQSAERAATLEQQAAQIEQVAAEHAKAVKDYPAWLVRTIAAEFKAVLDAGNNFLAAPSQKNWELFQTAKKEQLQRAGVHICKFDEASQRIAAEERKRLGDELAGMMETFSKNENALEARIAGVLAEQQRQQEQPVVNR